MATRTYARPYAQAAFEIARERDGLDKWQTDLDGMAGVVKDTDVLAWLEDPKTPVDTKIKLLGGVMEGVEPLAMNLLYLLLSRGQPGMVGDIAAEYRRLVDIHRGIEPAGVLTAVPLDDEDKKKLAERLAVVTGKKVEITAGVDPALLGGVVVRVGGKLLDGSTRSRLQALKTRIAQGES